jgi:hypothetical protein
MIPEETPADDYPWDDDTRVPSDAAIGELPAIQGKCDEAAEIFARVLAEPPGDIRSSSRSSAAYGLAEVEAYWFRFKSAGAYRRQALSESARPPKSAARSSSASRRATPISVR